MLPRLDALLSVNAGLHPDAVCLIQADGQRASYAALDAQASAVASHLRAIGTGPGDRIGLSAQKSIAAVAAIFGILRAGAAYVPVDPQAPLARSAGIFAGCGVRAVLCDDDVAGGLADALADRHPTGEGTGVDGLTCLPALTPGEPGDPAMAYILYTSGSTGVPKGVIHTHASAFAFVDWCSDAMRPTPDDRFSSHAPFHFDLSVFDLYLAIKHGAAIRIIGADEGRQPGALVDLAEKERLTFWYSTPTVLRSMLEFGGLEGRDLGALRVLCYAGEVFPTLALKAVARVLPHPAWWNLFGPTETNVCTAHRLTDPAGMADTDVVPVGVPVSGDRVRIAEDDGTAVPKGQPGELLVTGGSVMQGYWNLPDRNAAAFVTLDGDRYYRTGDIVVEQDDGTLIYHGRRDRMVKRRGFRIELGEIEAAMGRNAHLTRGAAVQVADRAGDIQIVHFFCGEGPDTSLLALKRYAATALPKYMIPDRFHRLDAIPMTSTDKVDYQCLKEIARGLFAE